MLTLEARGKGVSTLLMTLTRGEGGQNKLGSNLFDVLGVLRTLEVLAADRYYGVEQRFSRVADFGYSKTPEETFQKWQGHDIALGDMVRVIRTFRPDVLVARFSGTERDGHGHHQASAILTKEAFRAAADPKRFPEQIKEGLAALAAEEALHRQCVRLRRIDLRRGELHGEAEHGRGRSGARNVVHAVCDGGTAASAIARRGWRRRFPRATAFAFYKLVDSVVDSPKDKDGHEQDFFDGIDTTLPGLASRLGDEEKKGAVAARATVADRSNGLRSASSNAEGDSESRDRCSLSGRKASGRSAAAEFDNRRCRTSAKKLLASELETKRNQFQQAANLALGVDVEGNWYDAPVRSFAGDGCHGGAGSRVCREVVADFQSGEWCNSAKLSLGRCRGCQQSRTRESKSADKPCATSRVHFHMTPCAKAGYTRPYWHRHDPERDALNTIDEPQYQTLPFPPPPFHVRMRISV